MKNTFFIKQGVGIIAVFGVVILGITFWPRIEAICWPRKNVLVFKEDFEHYQDGEDRRIITRTVLKPEIIASSNLKKKSLELSGLYSNPLSNRKYGYGDTFGVIMDNVNDIVLEFDYKILKTKNKMPADMPRLWVYVGAEGHVYGSGCQNLLKLPPGSQENLIQVKAGALEKCLAKGSSKLYHGGHERFK